MTVTQTHKYSTENLYSKTKTFNGTKTLNADNVNSNYKQDQILGTMITYKSQHQSRTCIVSSKQNMLKWTEIKFACYFQERWSVNHQEQRESLY